MAPLSMAHEEELAAPKKCFREQSRAKAIKLEVFGRKIRFKRAGHFIQNLLSNYTDALKREKVGKKIHFKSYFLSPFFRKRKESRGR